MNYQLGLVLDSHLSLFYIFGPVVSCLPIFTHFPEISSYELANRLGFTRRSRTVAELLIPGGGKKARAFNRGLGRWSFRSLRTQRRQKKKTVRQAARQFVSKVTCGRKKKKKRRVLEMKGARLLRAQVPVREKKNKKKHQRIPLNTRPESSPDLGAEVLGKDANAGFTNPRHGGAVWGAGRGRYAPDLEFPFLSKLLSHLATRNPGNWGAIPFCCCHSWGCPPRKKKEN